MIGAQALIRTLTGCGVDVCFSNPGTSEMHFVAALDAVPAMRGVLCLFEGAATGAADGYGRMTGHPAAALLHLGPGLANALAGSVSAWVRRPASTPELAAAAAEAVAAAMAPPGGIATLILPADVSWSEGAEPAGSPAVRQPAPVPTQAV